MHICIQILQFIIYHTYMKMCALNLTHIFYICKQLFYIYFMIYHAYSDNSIVYALICFISDDIHALILLYL